MRRDLLTRVSRFVRVPTYRRMYTTAPRISVSKIEKKDWHKLETPNPALKPTEDKLRKCFIIEPTEGANLMAEIETRLDDIDRFDRNRAYDFRSFLDSKSGTLYDLGRLHDGEAGALPMHLEILSPDEIPFYVPSHLKENHCPLFALFLLTDKNLDVPSATTQTAKAVNPYDPDPASQSINMTELGSIGPPLSAFNTKLVHLGMAQFPGFDPCERKQTETILAVVGKITTGGTIEGIFAFRTSRGDEDNWSWYAMGWDDMWEPKDGPPQGIYYLGKDLDDCAPREWVLIEETGPVYVIQAPD